MKKITNIMSRNIVTISSDTNIKEIIHIMKEKNIGKLPVIENNKVIGVVERKSLLIKKESAPLPPVIAINDLILQLPNSKSFKERLNKLTGYLAKEIMETNFLKIDINDTLENLVTKLVEDNYTYALIFNNDSLEGIITETDLIKNIF
ncbi:CBS domain protein [Hypnocyclicus thermotrophus]|uniref:CBS domain protein n=1 Tax=Hypnocyclicus thermotrophus TaxID=1627895 RepID=A0AA46DXU8_9FUSO|nr:CBS domain-containing protein [Hypnocyclicus thermotrophus]TDT68652.1 CBS domain protein [Hypnocyclicus thermotrophus]